MDLQQGAIIMWDGCPIPPRAGRRAVSSLMQGSVPCDWRFVKDKIQDGLFFLLILPDNVHPVSFRPGSVASATVTLLIISVAHGRLLTGKYQWAAKLLWGTAQSAAGGR